MQVVCILGCMYLEPSSGLLYQVETPGASVLGVFFAQLLVAPSSSPLLGRSAGAE